MNHTYTPKQLEAFTARLQAEYQDRVPTTTGGGAYHLVLLAPLRTDTPCAVGNCTECAVSMAADEEDAELMAVCEEHKAWMLQAWPYKSEEDLENLAIGWLTDNCNAVDWLLP